VVAAIVAAAATAVGAAIVLAILDIYQTGHGRASLSRPWIDASFVHLSRADVVLLVAVLMSSLLAGAAVYRSR
jgi:hypothetical protein